MNLRQCKRTLRLAGHLLLWMPFRRRSCANGDLPRLRGVAPEPVLAGGSAVEWEDRFLETDGWEGYQDLAVASSDPKWWHVPDEKIAELVAQQQRQLGQRRRQSSRGDAGGKQLGTEHFQQDETREVAEADAALWHAAESGNAPKPKSWMVPDDAILKLIQDREAKHPPHLNETSAELLRLSPVTKSCQRMPKSQDISNSALTLDVLGRVKSARTAFEATWSCILP